MTDLLERTFIAGAVFIFVFAFGLQGFHHATTPPAQAQADLGGNDAPDSNAALSRG